MPENRRHVKATLKWSSSAEGTVRGEPVQPSLPNPCMVRFTSAPGGRLLWGPRASPDASLAQWHVFFMAGSWASQTRAFIWIQFGWFWQQRSWNAVDGLKQHLYFLGTAEVFTGEKVLLLQPSDVVIPYHHTDTFWSLYRVAPRS